MRRGGAALAHWRVREKGALETVSVVYQGSNCHCPFFLWLLASWGPLEFMRFMPVREEKEKLWTCSTKGKHVDPRVLYKYVVNLQIFGDYSSYLSVINSLTPLFSDNIHLMIYFFF